MQTRIISTLGLNDTDELSIILAPAINALKSNHPIAIPTETVYGLAANALSYDAVQLIFKVKGRPSDNPLIVHISSLDMIPQLLDPEYSPSKTYSLQQIHAFIPEIYHQAIKHFWPGPLTILLKSSPQIPLNVTAGQTTVAVRFPNHPIALEIIKQAGFPLAAPSANTSGRPSPTLAEHVLKDLNGKLEYIIDGGACESGLESTVLDGLGEMPVILRPGGVAYEDLVKLDGFENLKVYQKDFFSKQLETTPTTPGMKYTHYKPDADVYMLMCNDGYSDTLKERVASLSRNFKSVGVMGSEEFVETVKLICEKNTGEIHDLKFSKPIEYAQGLFKGLRDMEVFEVDCIFVQGVTEEREGMAIMNRLGKASTDIIY